MGYSKEYFQEVANANPDIIIDAIASLFKKEIVPVRKRLKQEKLSKFFKAVRTCVYAPGEVTTTRCLADNIPRLLYEEKLIDEDDIKRTIKEWGGVDGLMKAIDTKIAEALEEYSKSTFLKKFE